MDDFCKDMTELILFLVWITDMYINGVIGLTRGGHFGPKLAFCLSKQPQFFTHCVNNPEILLQWKTIEMGGGPFWQFFIAFRIFRSVMNRENNYIIYLSK
jgi:hypothetical protein